MPNLNLLPNSDKNQMLQVRPDINHLNEIHDWLKLEYLFEQKGYYYHWQKIKEAFEEGELLVYEVDGNAYGFIVYNDICSTWVIDIAAIKSVERNKGFGSAFVDQTIQYFGTMGAEKIKLYCSPRESESFWRKFGFDHSNDPLVELGTPLELKINANLNVNHPLTSVSFP